MNRLAQTNGGCQGKYGTVVVVVIEYSLEVAGAAIAAMVVGEHALHAYSHIGEGKDNAFKRDCCGDTAFIGQGIGIAAVVADGEMDVVVSRLPLPGRLRPLPVSRKATSKRLPLPSGMCPNFLTPSG